MGGGGTVWEATSYDPELNLIYFGVGNGIVWNQRYRSDSQGDNLFLSSIVALNADTGAYVWHYQATPGEEWDYDAVQDLILADLSIDGTKRQVLMQANKNGFFYVLDRKTGQLISAKNFTPVTWASGIDLKTGRPIENPGIRYDRELANRFRSCPAHWAPITGSQWRSTRRPGWSTSRRKKSGWCTPGYHQRISS